MKVLILHSLLGGGPKARRNCHGGGLRALRSEPTGVQGFCKNPKNFPGIFSKNMRKYFVE